MTIPVRVATNDVSLPVGILNDVAVPVDAVSTHVFPVSVAVTDVGLPVECGNNAVTIPVTFGMSMRSADFPWYDGAYEFTPSQEAQTIEIQDMVAARNITINPVPENYGLITWNGSVLTIS